MKINTFYWLFTISLSVLLFNTALAQQSTLYPDSIIVYSLRGQDTATKSPNIKYSFFYDAQNRISEKRIYFFQNDNKSWVERSLHTFQYIGNEVIEWTKPINFSNEELKTTYKFNKKGELTQYETELLDAKSKRYTLTYRRVYIYEKDSVKKIHEYKQGTSFFLSKETKFLGKETIERTYNELEPKLAKHVSTKLILNNKKQVSGKQKEQRNPIPLQYRVGYKLQNNIIVQDTLVYKSKSKKDSCDLIRTYFVNKGLLKGLVEYKTSKEGKPLQSEKGSFYVIFPTSKTKKTITRSDCFNKIEDVLIFSHLPW